MIQKYNVCIILTAGNPENVNSNDTSISINRTSYNAAANRQSMLQPESNEEIKMHSISSKNENTLNNSISNTLIPSTTSTTPSTTTTTSSTTTTLPPTTKSTTTSTPASTTTTVPTTSTTPLPPPSTGKWIVKENNTICILIQMAVQFNVSYTTDNVVSTQKLSL
ncbi:hypothetical protein ALC57_02445 [Trachymyrmex cornetzi]|uniref:Uncharacterized protein n=1 Tax=Trachymyrmex cornetzi TaxID=471704 RepID=A0A151JNI4_9HYME|nr:hypothetical protein ALC57_02445 [Trachymyrmex cornetzi]